MPPRKRQRSDANVLEEGETPGPSQVKRKRKILNYDPHEIIHELYETIRNHKTDDGRLLCESFIRVPKRRSAADYYEVVTTPIDLLKIQQKVKTDSYDYVDQLSADILLMVNNAKAYYKKGSQEYKDACELMSLYEISRADLVEAVFGSGERSERLNRKPMVVKETQDLPEDPEDEDESDDDDDEEEEEDDDDADQIDDSKNQSDSEERSSCVSEDIAEDLEQLFAAIVTTRDGDRDISQAFQLLPLKSKYPQYYAVIKNPIDLKMVASKIQESKYVSLDDLEKDLLTMVKNAKTFNEPKSLIYKDAVTLGKVISERKRELEYKKSGAVKSGRLTKKAKDTRSVIQKMSAVCAALKYQTSEDDAASSSQFEMDSEIGDNGNDLEEDDPQWILYNHVKNVTAEDGDLISEPFFKQPSKKFYPDYYHEIKKPMSFSKIRYKIEMNEYDTLMDLAHDFNLMFENAKKYNQDASQLYKDAVTLQKAMIEKLKELDAGLAEEFLEEVENNEEEDEEEEEEEEADGERNETVMEDDASASTPVVQRRRKSSLPTNNTPESERKRSAKKLADDSLKKRLRTLFSSIYDYSDTNGRLLRPIFMVLPSRKDYPDYYKVIMEPLDLTMIEAKLKADKYHSEQTLLADLELMFNNARNYNEAGSQVYQDANTLDKVLRQKWKSMALQAKLPGRKSKNTEASPLSEKLMELYEIVRDYQDRSGRALSSPFIKLPNRTDYPDYYEVVKRPIDMQRIQQKMMMGQYDNVEEMVADFVLMFDNACKYNEPESVIYRDALALQRVCFQKKLELMMSCGNEVPDVKALVQDLMKNLFISTFNHQDDEGRCYSDSFAELVEKDKALQLTGELTEAPLTFDQIRRNLDKGRYRRIDRFQDDMFKVIERAREVSRLDSQLYEDAVEMQKYLIITRDELCKNGELLLTPALSYTQRHLTLALEKEQKEKAETEKELGKQEEEEDVRVVQDSNSGEEDVEYKGQVYSKGDFVYISSRDAHEPHIIMIETFRKDDSGNIQIKGRYYYRPRETFHVATRKFLEKEVFLSDTYRDTSISEIIGRCCVVFVKEYFKFKPENIPDKDVFVCESRYISRTRFFKKIKCWNIIQSKNINLIPRDIPLVPTRIASLFAEKATSEEQLDESDTMIDKKRENIAAETESEDGNIYFEQYVGDNGCFKPGDGVYIRNPDGPPTIARIDKIWTDNIGETFFHYSCFLRPAEIEHAPNRLFFKQEVFQAGLEDCALIKNIVGKCCVLHMKEYCSSRPTEISEQDIFMNESKYYEGDKSIKRQKLLKKYTLSPKVVDDEVYFFRKPIALEKEPSPLLMKANADDSLFLDTEESQDAEPDASNDATSVSNNAPSPAPAKKRSKKGDIDPLDPASKRRLPSGYTVFAGETRKKYIQDNPGTSFGDISQVVGTRWRSMTQEEKNVYVERAKKMADEMIRKAKQERAEKEALMEAARSHSPWSDVGAQPSTPSHAGGQHGYNTPGQAHHPSGLFNGSNMQSPLHPGLSYSPPGYPYPGMGPVPPYGGIYNGVLFPNGPQQSPPSPVFVTVPPRSQKLLHSDVYIRYIEGLNTDSHTITKWDRTLNATQENAPVVAESSLPGEWLSQGAGCHGSVTNALWALRDMMLKDAVGLSRTISFDEL